MFRIEPKFLLIPLQFCICVAVAEVQTVKKYTVNFSEVQSPALVGLKSPAIGSGMVLTSGDSLDALTFLMITDRGPNIDGEKIKKKGQKPKESTIFPRPSFSPFIAEVVLENETARVVSIREITDKDGSKSSGLPQSEKDSAVPLDSELKILERNVNGIDPEGITVTPDGAVWICEEYAPSLIKLDRTTGRILERFSPGSGLPQIIQQRQENRGFEAITTTSEGQLLTALQSTLNINEETKEKAQFIRFLKFDPATQASEMFAYPLSDIKDTENKAVKIGDLTLIKENKFLAIETYKDKKDKRHARIVLLDLSEAEDITNKKHNELQLEYAKDISKIKQIKKTLLLDLAKIGWDKEKTEALAILADHKTVVISHDNDFGFSLEKTADKKIMIKEERKETELWLITFKDKIG